jgi:hypothetical protein
MEYIQFTIYAEQRINNKWESITTIDFDDSQEIQWILFHDKVQKFTKGTFNFITITDLHIMAAQLLLESSTKRINYLKSILKLFKHAKGTDYRILFFDLG